MLMIYLKINSESMMRDAHIDYNLFLHDDWKGHWMVETAQEISPNSDFMGFLDRDLVRLGLEMFDSMISVVVIVASGLSFITSLSIYTTMQRAYSMKRVGEVDYASL